eukprot:1889364-Prorocentrum_lima.AAC.1
MGGIKWCSSPLTTPWILSPATCVEDRVLLGAFPRPKGATCLSGRSFTSRRGSSSAATWGRAHA